MMSGHILPLAACTSLCAVAITESGRTQSGIRLWCTPNGLSLSNLPTPAIIIRNYQKAVHSTLVDDAFQHHAVRHIVPEDRQFLQFRVRAPPKYTTS